MAKEKETGTVISSKPVREDQNYEVRVLLDRDKKIITVRFPYAHKAGDKVSVDGRN